MKVIKVIILTTLLIILCGCEPKDEITSYCDEKYGIEYLRDTGFYHGGITIRLNEKGEVIHCEN